MFAGLVYDVEYIIVSEMTSLSRRMFALTSRENLKRIPRILHHVLPRRFTPYEDPHPYAIARYGDLARKYVADTWETALGRRIPEYFRDYEPEYDPEYEPEYEPEHARGNKKVARDSYCYLMAQAKINGHIPAGSYIYGDMVVSATKHNARQFLEIHCQRQPILAVALNAQTFQGYSWGEYEFTREDAVELVRYPGVLRAMEEVLGEYLYTVESLTEVCYAATEAGDTRALSEFVQMYETVEWWWLPDHLSGFSVEVVREVAHFLGGYEDITSCTGILKLWDAGAPMDILDLSRIESYSYRDNIDGIHLEVLSRYYAAFPDDTYRQALSNYSVMRIFVALDLEDYREVVDYFLEYVRTPEAFGVLTEYFTITEDFHRSEELQEFRVSRTLEILREIKVIFAEGTLEPADFVELLDHMELHELSRAGYDDQVIGLFTSEQSPFYEIP